MFEEGHVLGMFIYMSGPKVGVICDSSEGNTELKPKFLYFEQSLKY